MADHRVDRLRLQLHATPGGRADLKEAAEGFVARILEAVGDRLESRWPGRLFFLKRLQLQWKIGDAELADPSAVSRYADEIAGSFGDSEPRRPGRPAAKSDVVIFRDEANWWACYLAAQAEGKDDAWEFRDLRTKGTGFESLAVRGHEFAAEVLMELAESWTLIPVVRMVGEERAARMCDVLGAAASPAWKGNPPNPGLMKAARSVPADLPSASTRLVVYVEALRLAGRSASFEEIARMTEAVTAEIARERGAAAPESGEAVPQRESVPEAETFDTRFGGLFYLLTLALELDIGEMLWKACLPEGAVLAHVAAALLGEAEDGDPAALLFGGQKELQPVEVLAEQQEEVAAALIVAVAEALPRRGLAILPELMLRMLPIGGTPLLMASPVESEFLLFAWPGADSRTVERGIRAFLGGWPRSAPGVLGTPAIAALEGGVRIREAEGVPKAEVFTVGAGSASASALISQVAGALAYVFAARAGVGRAGAAALTEHYFAVPGRVTLAPEEMVVTLPMERIEPDLRRSGLDLDPGWVPWLGRRVRFEFTGEGQEG